MTAALFFGCFLVAFGPPLALFFSAVLPKSQLVVVCVSSAFFWLLSLAAAAILWYILPWEESYWFVMTLSVCLQELARWICFHFYAKAERSFSVVSTNAIAFPLKDSTSSIAAGLGFGLTFTGLLYGSFLANATGPGTLFSEHCPHMSAFVLSAWIALAFNVLHVALMVLAFHSYRQKSRPMVFLVFVLHLIASLMTLVNRNDGGCRYSIPLVWIIALGAVLLAWIVMRQPTHRSSRSTRIRTEVLEQEVDLRSPILQPAEPVQLFQRRPHRGGQNDGGAD